MCCVVLLFCYSLFMQLYVFYCCTHCMFFFDDNDNAIVISIILHFIDIILTLFLFISQLLTPRSLDQPGPDGRPTIEYVRDVYAELMAMVSECDVCMHVFIVNRQVLRTNFSELCENLHSFFTPI